METSQGTQCLIGCLHLYNGAGFALSRLCQVISSHRLPRSSLLCIRTYVRSVVVATWLGSQNYGYSIRTRTTMHHTARPMSLYRTMPIHMQRKKNNGPADRQPTGISQPDGPDLPITYLRASLVTLVPCWSNFCTLSRFQFFLDILTPPMLNI